MHKDHTPLTPTSQPIQPPLYSLLCTQLPVPSLIPLTFITHPLILPLMKKESELFYSLWQQALN